MRLLLVVDVFSPVRTSAAVQMSDLAVALGRLGHQCTIVTPDAGLAEQHRLEREFCYSVLRIRSAPLKRISLIRRALNEILLSSRLWRGYRASPAANQRFDGVIFYSPTIFLGRFVAKVKSLHHCPAYLILRDIFPDWSADLKLMRKGPHYWLFKAFAAYQYSVADMIGVESQASWDRFLKRLRRVEVLQNWIELDGEPAPDVPISQEILGAKILVYAGNMGIAQDLDNLVRLAQALAKRSDARLLFVGGGSERERIVFEVTQRQLKNVRFVSEVDPQTLRGLLRRCHVGLVSLDRRLRSHNIPGKLLSYLEAGLPVLASVNAGNEIKHIVENGGAGVVTWNGDDGVLLSAADRMLDDAEAHEKMSAAAMKLCKTLFSSSRAAEQVSRFFSAPQAHRGY